MTRKEDPASGVENTLEVKDLDANLAEVQIHNGEGIRPRMQFLVWSGWPIARIPKGMCSVLWRAIKVWADIPLIS